MTPPTTRAAAKDAKTHLGACRGAQSPPRQGELEFGGEAAGGGGADGGARGAVSAVRAGGGPQGVGRGVRGGG